MNFLKDISCAIFDLDGTLIQSISTWRHVDMHFMEKEACLSRMIFMTGFPQ